MRFKLYFLKVQLKREGFSDELHGLLCTEYDPCL